MTIDFAGLRTKMVDGQVRTTDVTNLPVLDAMLAVPREAFVPAPRQSLAYIDEDIELAPGRYLMEPSPFARLVQLAGLRAADHVLDVGAGSGYSSAVLSKIAASVVALECEPALAAQARAALASLDCDNVVVVEGGLEAGHAARAPYDVIMLQGAVECVPEALFGQLRDGGRLVTVEGLGNAGKAQIYVKHGGVVSGRPAFNAAVRPLPGFHTVRAFEF